MRFSIGLLRGSFAVGIDCIGTSTSLAIGGRLSWIRRCWLELTDGKKNPRVQACQVSRVVVTCSGFWFLKLKPACSSLNFTVLSFLLSFKPPCSSGPAKSLSLPVHLSRHSPSFRAGFHAPHWDIPIWNPVDVFRTQLFREGIWCPTWS